MKTVWTLSNDKHKMLAGIFLTKEAAINAANNDENCYVTEFEIGKLYTEETPTPNEWIKEKK